MTETNNSHSRHKRDTACQCNTKPPKASQSTTIDFLDTSKRVKIIYLGESLYFGIKPYYSISDANSVYVDIMIV